MFKNRLVLEASAGSGKTFALSIRYVSLLFLGANPESVLTLTFTNKAANEMLERISGLLKNLHDKDTELDIISKLTNLGKEDILKKQPFIYQNFLKANLNISTIDKFNAGILRSFSLHQGLMPDFKVGQTVDEHRFLTLFIQSIIKNNLYSELIEFSVYEQKRLVQIFGFLNTLNQKRHDLKDIKINSFTIDGTKKEVLKIFSYIKDMFYDCSSLSNAAKKALLCDTPEDIANQTWIEKDSLSEYKFFKKCYDPKVDEYFLELKDTLKNYFLAKESYYKLKYLKIFEVYKSVKIELNIQTNTLEFNDITNFVYELLQGKEVDSEFLYFRLDSKIDHILIDEFQDTSVTQYKILEPLISEITSGFGVKEFKSFFYVGDTKQSIYRFRGGTKELFSYVQNRFDIPIEILNSNYRSTEKVVEFVNSTFASKIQNYHLQIPFNQEDSGYIKVSKTDELLTLVKDEILELLEQGVHEDDIAILTYANGDAFIIEEELLKANSSLNITTTTTLKLINTPIVCAVIEFLKYLYFKENLYLANFLSLTGKDLETKIDLSLFSIKKELNFLIKDIISHFNLFYYDENLLKLIEIANNYKDIDEFLYKYEELDTASPKKKDKGIKILTIHKSKGLEFDHVIVVDRFKKKPPSRESMLFYYDKIVLKDMYIRFKNRELFDNDYFEAKEALKALEVEDELNTLYVALTRAKNSVVICQKEKDSALAILALEEKIEGSVIASKDIQNSVVYDEFKYESIKTGFQDKKKSEIESSSDLNAINFGIALHYMLENLNEFKQDEIEVAYWAMKNRFEIKLENNQSLQIKKRVENLLKDEKFLSLVDGKCHKELSLIYNGEIKQLDLVVEKDDKIVVIDYKSSDFVQDKHLKQVTYYKKALHDIFKKDIEGYVCYIRNEVVEFVGV